MAKKKMKKTKSYLLEFNWRNWAFIGGGLFFICIGYLLLWKGSITLSPILLVIGYCVLIPIGIIIK